MGKNKYIESPEKLWEHFEAYKKETKSKPILVQDFVGKDGEEVYRKKERPLSIDGFEVWCFNNGIISHLSDYFANSNQKYTEYSTICYAIKKEVRNDQIEGGMAGIYNPSITQRLNGLTEKIQNEQNININKMPEWLKAPIENSNLNKSDS
jgi:hypothetical protein